jgi:hypothetical protein
MMRRCGENSFVTEAQRKATAKVYRRDDVEKTRERSFGRLEAKALSSG